MATTTDDTRPALPVAEREPYLRKLFVSLPFTYPERVGDFPSSLFEPVEQTAVVLNQLFEAAKVTMRKHGGELPPHAYIFCRRHPVNEDPAGRGLYVMRWKDAESDTIESPQFKDAFAMIIRGLAGTGDACAAMVMANVWLANVTGAEHDAAIAAGNEDALRPSKRKDRREATMLMYESLTTAPSAYACSVNRFGRRGIVLGEVENLTAGATRGESRFIGLLEVNRQEASFALASRKHRGL